MTLNFWGIPGISKDRKERLHALVEVLLHGEYDFVLLQELWSASDYDLIRNKCATVFPFGHYFYSGVIGAGIAILSRWRIVDTFFHPWSVNGYMHKIHHGDWWGGKGVGACTVDKDGYRINLYVAHVRLFATIISVCIITLFHCSCTRSITGTMMSTVPTD